MSFIRKIKRNGKIYLAEVENTWVNGRCVQKHIKYIGRSVDNKIKLAASISDIEIDQVKVYGPLLLLHHLASEAGMPALLGKYSNEILSLVYAHCLDYKSINQMESWFDRTDLSFLLTMEDVTEKRLLTALDSLDYLDKDKLQHTLFETLCEKFSISKQALIYDVTNTYLYGNQCVWGKYGHDKEGVKGRPLIQIALAVTQEEGIPLFHKVFNGNVHDARTFQDFVIAFKKYKLQSGLMVYDRGISSAENVKDLSELKWDTLCGLPLHTGMKKVIRPIVRQNFITLENRIKLNKTIFYVLTIPYKIGEAKGTLAICFNETRRREIRESRYDEIEAARELLLNKKPIKEGLEKFFDTHGNLLEATLKEAEEFDGYSFIFSTRMLSKEEMVRIYFDKDVVEKAFRSLKGITKLQPIRHWLSHRVVGHIMICYLSYTLLAMLKHYMKPLEISAETALQELESLYKVYMRDSKKEFKITKTVSLTKNQKKILGAVSKSLLKNPSV